MLSKRAKRQRKKCFWPFSARSEIDAKILCSPSAINQCGEFEWRFVREWNSIIFHFRISASKAVGAVFGLMMSCAMCLQASTQQRCQWALKVITRLRVCHHNCTLMRFLCLLTARRDLITVKRALQHKSIEIKMLALIASIQKRRSIWH